MRLAALALPLVVATSGCASIVSKSSWPVSVTATPPDSEVEVYDESGRLVHKARAPFTVSLESGAGYFAGEKYTFKASAPGHAPAQATVDTSMNGWYWGNLLFGGLIGFFLVDPATGAMWKLPATVHVSSSPEPAKP
jgi:hypothetical protein